MVQKWTPKPPKSRENPIDATKTRKVAKQEASLEDEQAFGPNFGDLGSHFRFQNCPQILIFSMQENNTILTSTFECFLLFFWCFSEWIFEPMNPQIWAYRVDETLFFSFLAFPNHVRKTSRLRVMKKWDFGSIWGQILRGFGYKNASRKQVKKMLFPKQEKSSFQRPRVDLGHHQPMDFGTQTACWGGRGGLTKNNLLVI